MDSPKVSVIVPCFNQGDFLHEALDSVFKQKYSNWECIIINDGSTDCTERVATEWVKKDDRYKYFKITNGGLAHARNFGLAQVSGEYVQFLDADDLLNLNKLQFCLDNINGDVPPDIIVTNFKYFENDIKFVYDPHFNLDSDFLQLENILMLWPAKIIPIHCGLFRASIFTKIKFVESLKAWEDWIMWIMVLKNNPKITFIDKPLGLYRSHPSNMTSDTFLMENYHLKAVNYVLENIPLEEKIRSHFEELQKFKNKTRKLENTIKNYRNTRTFKYSEKLKNLELIRILMKLKKRFHILLLL